MMLKISTTEPHMQKKHNPDIVSWQNKVPYSINAEKPIPRARPGISAARAATCSSASPYFGRPSIFTRKLIKVC